MGIIETLIENKEPIILDATNKVFVGPDGYFKIVIDEFDGTTIKAWHIEGPGGVKTANLAMPSNGKHIDAIINSAGNSTARGLYTDMAPAVLQKMLEAQKM